MFAPESVPDACTCFVRECVPGLTKRQLLARRRARGWAPAWRPLPHLVREGFEAFAFDLIVDGGAPVIAWMQRVGKDVELLSVFTRDPCQLSLF